MAQMVYGRVYKEIRISRREQLMLLEIEEDFIDTASSFVDYMKDEYGFSKSSVWYCLNRLKGFGLVEFANKDEIGKPLSLTRHGLDELARLESIRNEVIDRFSGEFVQKMQSKSASANYANRYNGMANGVYAYR